jgi:cytochrome P450
MGAPTSNIDLYSDEIIQNPYPYYRELRAVGPAVRMSRHACWAIPRYQEVVAVLRDGELFSSAHGVTLNETGNRAQAGTMLASDDPLHMRMRRIFAEPLMPKALASLRAGFEHEADALAARLMAGGAFDAVSALACYLPLLLVRTLVGLPEAGRARMLEWASAMFDAFGPADNARTQASFPVIAEVAQYLANPSTIANLVPGSWAARLFEFAARGELTHEQATTMLLDYTGPALDTTINATSAAIWLFAQHPDQWDLLRSDVSLIRGAIDEVIRMESPIRAFSRYVVRETDLGGVQLDAGSRVLVLYASANRDESRWADPERFDIQRGASAHVGFGHGPHLCAGMHLARMEITAILGALVRRVRRFELLGAERTVHNTLRGFRSLTVRAEPI